MTTLENGCVSDVLRQRRRKLKNNSNDDIRRCVCWGGITKLHSRSLTVDLREDEGEPKDDINLDHRHGAVVGLPNVQEVIRWEEAQEN